MNNPKYIEIGKYVIENQVSKTQTCKYFSITKRMLKDYMRSLKRNKYWLYKNVMEIFNENPSNRGDLPKYLGITQYIQNSKADKGTVCKRFKINNKNLYDSLRYLNKKNNRLYNRVKDILN